MEKPLAGSNPMLHFQIRIPSTGVRPSTTLFHGLLCERGAAESAEIGWRGCPLRRFSGRRQGLPVRQWAGEVPAPAVSTQGTPAVSTQGTPAVSTQGTPRRFHVLGYA